MKKIQLLILFFYAFSGLLFPGASPLLDGIVRAALENDQSVRSARLDYLVRKARKTEAFSGFLPSLNLSGNYSKSMQTVTDFSGNLVNLPEKQNYSGTLSLKQNVFSGFSTMASYGIASANALNAEITLDKTIRDVTASVLFTCYDILKNYELLELYKKQKEIAEKRKEEVTVKIEAGLATKSELLRTEIDITNTRISIIRTENTIEKLMFSLKTVTGIKGFDVAAFKKEMLSDEGRQPESEKLEIYIVSGLEKRPEILLMKKQKEIAIYGLRQARAAFLPGLNLSASYGKSDDQLPLDNSSWSVGASISFNIFNGWADRSKTAAAGYDLKNTEEKETGLKREIEYDITQSYLSYRESAERKTLAGQSLEQAQLNMSGMEEKFRLGLATMLELQDAELLYKNSTSELIQAGFDMRVNEITLLKASGREFYTVPGVKK